MFHYPNLTKLFIRPLWTIDDIGSLFEKREYDYDQIELQVELAKKFSFSDYSAHDQIKVIMKHNEEIDKLSTIDKLCLFYYVNFIEKKNLDEDLKIPKLLFEKGITDFDILENKVNDIILYINEKIENLQEIYTFYGISEDNDNFKVSELNDKNANEPFVFTMSLERALYKSSFYEMGKNLFGIRTLENCKFLFTGLFTRDSYSLLVPNLYDLRIIQLRNESLKKKCSQYIIEVDREGFRKSRWRLARKDDNLICDVDTGGAGDCLYYSVGTGMIQLSNLYGKINSEMNTVVDKLKTRGTYLRKYLSKYLRIMHKKLVVHDFFGSELDDEWWKQDFLWTAVFTEREANRIIRAETEDDAYNIAKEIYLKSSHWGVHFDIQMIQSIFKIGIIVMNRDGKLFYCTGERKTFDYYILIFNYDNIHYTLGGIYVDKFDNIVSSIRSDDVPEWFREKYYLECSLKI